MSHNSPVKSPKYKTRSEKKQCHKLHNPGGVDYSQPSKKVPEGYFPPGFERAPKGGGSGSNG